MSKSESCWTPAEKAQFDDKVNKICHAIRERTKLAEYRLDIKPVRKSYESWKSYWEKKGRWDKWD